MNTFLRWFNILKLKARYVLNPEKVKVPSNNATSSFAMLWLPRRATGLIIAFCPPLVKTTKLFQIKFSPKGNSKRAKMTKKKARTLVDFDPVIFLAFLLYRLICK